MKTNSLQHIDIADAVYRHQGFRFFKKTGWNQEISLQKKFLQEIRLRNELREAYADSSHEGTVEELVKVIEIVRNPETNRYEE